MPQDQITAPFYLPMMDAKTSVTTQLSTPTSTTINAEVKIASDRDVALLFNSNMLMICHLETMMNGDYFEETFYRSLASPCSAQRFFQASFVGSLTVLFLSDFLDDSFLYSPVTAEYPSLSNRYYYALFINKGI